MKLHDLGASILIIGLLLGSHFVAYKHNPDYKFFVDKTKQHISDFNEKFIDPYRTPEDDIDNPIWNSDIG